MSRIAFIASAAWLVATAAIAQMPPGAVMIRGEVTALTEDRVTVKSADGKVVEAALSPVWSVVVSTPVDIDAIKPGAFIATANVNEGADQGRAIELRMFEPGSKAGEGSRPMPQANTTMTNATVSKITKGANGREIDVVYPGGTRHIVVPPDVQLMASLPAERSALKPGVNIVALGVAADGGLEVGRITVTPKP